MVFSSIHHLDILFIIYQKNNFNKTMIIQNINNYYKYFQFLYAISNSGNSREILDMLIRV